MSMPECRRFFPVRRRSNLSCKCDACSAVTHAFEMREDGYNVLGSISPGDMIRCRYPSRTRRAKEKTSRKTRCCDGRVFTSASERCLKRLRMRDRGNLVPLNFY